jgi:hypothetical protein
MLEDEDVRGLRRALQLLVTRGTSRHQELGATCLEDVDTNGGQDGRDYDGD